MDQPPSDWRWVEKQLASQFGKSIRCSPLVLSGQPGRAGAEIRDIKLLKFYSAIRRTSELRVGVCIFKLGLANFATYV